MLTRLNRSCETVLLFHRHHGYQKASDKEISPKHDFPSTIKTNQLFDSCKSSIMYNAGTDFNTI